MSDIGEFLQYKPQLATPKDSARVYFACHPNDFDGCFERFSDEILSITHSLHTTTTVWYRTADNLDADHKDGFLSRLTEIQLFVVPVTQQLLNDRAACLDIEIEFAKKLRKPILPILWDTSLIQEYSKPENFGDLQFLNPDDPDTTALPYEKKLEDYLSSVLVGDEMRAKVQAAFDAYIFLSYRKKDRSYAQELMKLIHKNDFCRDIAIWYDEFLTPGEDFNKAIVKALNDSKLFALVVTPNIVEPGNYVIDHEYPMAETAKKPIVALESVTTDRVALEKNFKSLPECTDVHDPTKLSNALLQNLKSVARSESRDNPDHNYLIGLAYLNGIDVETDYEKAKALIEGAAESGLPDAMLELASIYKTGKGVKQNHRKTIQWLEKAVDHFEEAAKSNNQDDIKRFSNTLFYLSAEYMAVGDHKHCDDALIKLIELYTAALDEKPDEDYIGMVLVAYVMRSGNAVHLYVEKNPNATITDTFKVSTDVLLDAEKFCDKYSEFVEGVDWIHNYALMLYMQMCNGYASMGDFDTAKRYLNKLKSAENYDSVKNMITAMESNQNILLTFADNFRNTLDSVDQQLVGLSKEDQEFNCATFLIGSYSAVCSIYTVLDDTVDRQEMRELLYRYLSTVSQFDCNKASNDAVLALCSVLLSVADFEIADGNIEKATELCQKSLALSKMSFERYSSEEPLENVILSTAKLDQLRGDGKLDPEAWRFVDKCYKTIFAENYDRIQNFELADTYYFSMIIVNEQENNIEKAKDYAKAREYLSFVKQKESGSLDDEIKFCDNIYSTCHYMYMTGEFETSEDRLSLSIRRYAEILNEPQKHNLTKELYEHIGVMLCKSEFLLAAIYSELDREDEAEKELELFLEAAQHFKHCPELAAELAIAEEMFADDGEDDEEE